MGSLRSFLGLGFRSGPRSRESLFMAPEEVATRVDSKEERPDRRKPTGVMSSLAERKTLKRVIISCSMPGMLAPMMAPFVAQSSDIWSDRDQMVELGKRNRR